MNAYQDLSLHHVQEILIEKTYLENKVTKEPYDVKHLTIYYDGGTFSISLFGNINKWIKTRMEK